MDKKIIGGIVILLLCCVSSSVAVSISMNREDEDPIVPKTPTKKTPTKKTPEQIKADEAKVYAATAKAKLDELLAGKSLDGVNPPTHEDITDARNEAENAQAEADHYQAEADAAAVDADAGPSADDPCNEGYIKSGKKCTKLTRKSGAEHIKRGTPPENADFKADYYYESGTYYDGGEVFNENTLFTDFPNSTHSDIDRQEHCFKKCDDDDKCELVTFATGTPRDLGNWNVECWGRSKDATRVERSSDGRFTRGDNIMDSDYHNTYHKKSATNIT